MHAESCDYGVPLGVNDADIVRSGIHHVNFIFPAVRRNPGRFAANSDGFRKLKSSQIDDAHGVALAIGDVGVLMVCRAVIGELLLVKIQPRDSGNNRREDYDEKKLSQVSGATEEPRADFVDTDGSAAGASASAATVLPTTGAICRTCAINSSN